MSIPADYAYAELAKEAGATKIPLHTKSLLYMEGLII